jgi:hypothetical protein
MGESDSRRVNRIGGGEGERGGAVAAAVRLVVDCGGRCDTTDIIDGGNDTPSYGCWAIGGILSAGHRRGWGNFWQPNHQLSLKQVSH